jgi:hypothetical protein
MMGFKDSWDADSMAGATLAPGAREGNEPASGPKAAP